MNHNNFLVIHNVAKKSNFRALCITAAAHSFSVLTIGRYDDKLPTSDIPLKIINFCTLDDCVRFLDDRNIPLVGIEIMTEAVSFLQDPFTHPIAFMPGNEGTGLNGPQRDACNAFVYIPQYGMGTASLNVNVATALILHRFTTWRNRTSADNIPVPHG